VTREIRFGQQDPTGDGPLEAKPRRPGVEGGRAAGRCGDLAGIPALRSSVPAASEYAGEQLSLDEHADGWTLHREGATMGEVARRSDGFVLRAGEDCWTVELVQPQLASWRLVLRGASDHADVGVYVPRRVGTGGTLTLGDIDRHVLKGPWIFRNWIVENSVGAELARIRACPGGETPERRPVQFGPQVDGKPSTTLVVLAACVAVIVSEGEQRCAVGPVPLGW
jgi:hypothetical protein